MQNRHENRREKEILYLRWAGSPQERRDGINIQFLLKQMPVATHPLLTSKRRIIVASTLPTPIDMHKASPLVPALQLEATTDTEEAPSALKDQASGLEIGS
jgi:hypothetical protein